MTRNDRNLAKYGAFDPSEPFNAAADMFRRQIGAMFGEFHGSSLANKLTPQEQVAAFVAGIEVGLIGICFSCVEPNERSRRDMMKFIRAYLPQAKDQAEGILESAEAK